jgi:hypothetical protein
MLAEWHFPRDEQFQIFAPHPFRFPWPSSRHSPLIQQISVFSTQVRSAVWAYTSWIGKLGRLAAILAGCNTRGQRRRHIKGAF